MKTTSTNSAVSWIKKYVQTYDYLYVCILESNFCLLSMNLSLSFTKKLQLSYVARFLLGSFGAKRYIKHYAN